MKYLILLQKIVPAYAHTTLRAERTIFITNTNLLFVLTTTKKHINFRYSILSCISGVDFLSVKYRYSVVYDLLSLTFNNRIRVKIFVNETTSINSIVTIYKNAN